MKERLFRFKKFSVHHSRSAMKVGVDGVLIGSWCNLHDARTVLDVGSGCGLIALMCAQRNSEAEIFGIETDEEAVAESRVNVAESPWAGRVKIIAGDACSVAGGRKYDRIVSNPPFFDAGLAEISTTRELARHCGTLSPFSLIDIAEKRLADNGFLSMILPAGLLGRLLFHASERGFHAVRICNVRGHVAAPVKRTMVELSREAGVCDTTLLILETTPGNPTEAYRALCKDFYLKF